MRPDPLLLLPLVAVGLALFFPIFDKRVSQGVSRSLRSRKRRLIVLGRVAVVTLFLAALVAELWPLWPDDTWGKALQGSVMALAVLVPLYIAHLVATWRRRRVGNEPSGVAQTADSEPVEPARASPAAEPLAMSSPEPAISSAPSQIADSELDVPTLHVSKGVAHGHVGDERLTRRPAPARLARHESEGHRDEPVNDQLDRVAALVDSIDLGGQGGERSRTSVRPKAADDELVYSTADTTTAATVATDGGSLATVEPPKSRPTAQALVEMSDGEIVLWVDKLRDDKRRLQKLVIAQRAAHVSERQAHERTRTAARRVVRTALESQKIAEKIARRERRTRLQTEEKYDRVSSALGNAVSILEARKILERANETSVETLTPAATPRATPRNSTPL